MTLAYDVCRCHNTTDCHRNTTCARWVYRDDVEPNRTPHDIFAPDEVTGECEEFRGAI